jgi:hypothetical protein
MKQDAIVYPIPAMIVNYHVKTSTNKKTKGMIITKVGEVF